MKSFRYNLRIFYFMENLRYSFHILIFYILNHSINFENYENVMSILHKVEYICESNRYSGGKMFLENILHKLEEWVLNPGPL